MNKARATTHAYIITGGDQAARREQAEILGSGILDQVGQQVSATTFTTVQPDKSITREQITGLLHDLSMTAFGGEHRIIIIEGAEQMTPEAGNALLKSLEEPPEHVVFILLAPTVARLMPTLRSRSQIVSVGVKQGLSGDSHDDRLHEFFSSTVTTRFAQIAQLTDRTEQLDFVQGLLRLSQQQRNFGFAAWLQERLVKTQKSGNIRLLLEASALVAGEGGRV